MCYVTHISTDCADNLAVKNTTLIRFEKVLPETRSPESLGLQFPHIWYIGSKSGCSCTFRHLYKESVTLGFAEPQDWYPEEQDSIDATKQMYATIREIVSKGFQIDLIDRWNGCSEESVTILEVPLSSVPNDKFRLFENYLFRFKQ